MIRDEEKNNNGNIRITTSVIVLDHQPSSTIVDSHQQEQTLPQSSKQLESLLLTRITLPTKGKVVPRTKTH
ncbi:hypothetical protein Pst134EB_026438 [Puccinia striiformis f. sp. tritici]|nr:hypothetical protein Pst134EB_026438 [Puccinia striiformis f. sp. tritici]